MEKSIEERLSELRVKYKNTVDPVEKKILVARGKALKNSLKQREESKQIEKLFK